MRLAFLILVLNLTGCSTAPVTNLMDFVHPSQAGERDRPPPRIPERGGRMMEPGIYPLDEPIPVPRGR